MADKISKRSIDFRYKRKNKKTMTPKEMEKVGRNFNAAILTKTEGSFMGGGMMRPMKAAGGAAISAIAAGAGAIGAAGLRANKKIADRAKEKKKKNAMKNMKDVSKNNLPKKKMGGGMMKQPMGYNTGGEAKVRGMGAAIRGGKFQGVF